MTPPTDDFPWERLTALLAGTLPPDEAERLQAWLAEDPTRQDLAESLRMVWTAAAEGRPSWDACAALETIKARAGERTKILSLPSRFAPHSTRTHARRPALIAAALVGICAGAWWGARGPLNTPTAAPIALTRYETSRAQRLAFKLPDGTTVMLGPDSKLRYASTYAQHDRIVELHGDAYFQVTHDAAHPFEVRAEHAVLRDLGTRFVVRARDASHPIDVVVAEGRVAVGRTAAAPAPRATDTLGAARLPLADSLVLGSGDLGRVSAAGAVSRERGVPLDRYFGWTEGRLVFQAARLRDVVAELSRWYDVDIRLVGSGVGDLRLTATFHDQPITEVLALVEASLRLKLIAEGRQFTLAAQ